MNSILETCLHPDIRNIPEALQLAMAIGAIHTTQAIIRTIKDSDVKDLSTLLHIIGLFTVARLVFQKIVWPRPSLSTEAISTSPPDVPIFLDESSQSQEPPLEPILGLGAQLPTLPDLLSTVEQGASMAVNDNRGSSSVSCDTGAIDTNPSLLLRRRPGQYFQETARARLANVNTVTPSRFHQNNFDRGTTVAGITPIQTAWYPNGYVPSELYFQTELTHEYNSTNSTSPGDDLPVIPSSLESPFSYHPPSLTIHGNENEAGLLTHNEDFLSEYPWHLPSTLYPGRRDELGSSLLFARSPPGLRLPNLKAPPGVPFCNFREGYPGQIIVEVGRKFNLRTLRSLTNGKPPTSALGMVVLSNDEPPANYCALELLIQSVEMQELLASIQTMSITTPHGFVPSADPEGHSLVIPRVPELRDFTCDGSIGSLPRPWRHMKNLPLEQLQQLNLVNCSVSPVDCLSVLSRCTNLITCRVDCLDNSTIGNGLSLTRVLMNKLNKLFIATKEDVDLTSFFQVLQTISMTTLSLRLPHGARPDKFCLPWHTLNDIHIHNELDCIDELRRKAYRSQVAIHCNF